MYGVLLGFGVVLVLVSIGFAVASMVPSRAHAMQSGLTPAIYYITNPALMLMLLAETDLGSVMGVYTPIALMTAAASGAAYALLSSLVFRRKAAQTAVGAMASSYVNAGNIGLPIALYAVGSPAPVVAVLLAQLLVVAPSYLVVFAWCQRRRAAPAGALPLTLIRSVANPSTMATFAGATLSLTGFHLPEVLWAPVQMLGKASIPLLLLVFGISFYGQRPFKERGLVPDVVLATTIKLCLMPVVAWAAAHFVFRLEGVELFGVVVMAALPTAQNVFLFSQQFDMPTAAARDVIFLTSLLALPVILAASILLQ
ncbi:AEC family transporter [Specibacter sp. RAF43]|uniref:AEC family transporter n=1 Tax=Specibacter sp. RAF43 TaxID=3233057 RepID=UPI003F98D8B5